MVGLADGDTAAASAERGPAPVGAVGVVVSELLLSAELVRCDGPGKSLLALLVRAVRGGGGVLGPNARVRMDAVRAPRRNVRSLLPEGMWNTRMRVPCIHTHGQGAPDRQTNALGSVQDSCRNDCL